MKVLFLFLDGVGLGSDNPEINPLARAELPYLYHLLGNRRLLKMNAPLESQRASLLPLDAALGVTGLPQSATGQATLLTGRNIPAILGYHYGPKPNPAVAEFLTNGTLFNVAGQKGKSAGLLNAYPPRYFEAIRSGLRMYSAIPLAVTSAGIPLRTDRDLFAGQALSVDFTGDGWRTQLGIPETPVLEPFQAGERLAQLSQALDFAFFEYWPSDLAGHHQDMDTAIHLLQTFDQVLAGLLESWDDQAGLVLITSDHGNLEDLSTRRHTLNPVPALVIGAAQHRREFTRDLKDLSSVAPAILRMLEI